MFHLSELERVTRRNFIEPAYRWAVGEDMSNPILAYFAYAHLPPNLQAVSAPLGKLAEEMNALLPESAEKSAGLRKLLEAKDCFVRAALPTK